MLRVVVLFGLLAFSSGASVGAPLSSMDPLSLATFTRLFRQTLLNKIALEVNNTVDMSEALKPKADACNMMINATIDQCKTCAKATCQSDPTFLDYLSLVSPYTYLKGPMDYLAGGFTNVVEQLGTDANGFFNSLKALGGSVTGTVSDELSSAFGKVKIGLDALGDLFTRGGRPWIDTGILIGDGLTDVGNAIGNVLTDPSTFENIGKKIGNIVGGIFGRKKRELSAQTRQCMEKCEKCKPLLLPAQEEIVAAVCGSEIVNANKTIQANLEKIKGVYADAIDKVNPIIKEFKFDLTSMNAKMELTVVHLTVFMNGQYVSYKSQVPYALTQLPNTAAKMAMEYWGKFQ